MSSNYNAVTRPMESSELSSVPKPVIDWLYKVIQPVCIDYSHIMLQRTFTNFYCFFNSIYFICLALRG